MLHKTTPLLILFASLTLGSSSCSTPKNNDNSSEESTLTYDELTTIESTDLNAKITLKGKITSETFVNKGGKEISTIQDLYFDSDGSTYFIKFMASNISYEEALELIDQPIEIEGELRDGMWDIPDENPAYAQSRGGLYLVILKVLD